MHTIEHLELRRLLSVALKSNGTLQINGTSGQDVVRIGFDDTFVNLVAVTLNSKQKLFQPRDVLRINVETLTGHDRVVVDRSLGALGSIKLDVDTGKGNDRVTIEDISNVKTVVLLGDGNDTLSTVRGEAFGGAGNDLMTGSSATKIYGGSGNDELVSAWASGDDDNDVTVGTNGRDTLHGGSGDDTFIGGLGDDLLVGGTGEDKYFFGSEEEIQDDQSSGVTVDGNIDFDDLLILARYTESSHSDDGDAVIIASGGITMTGGSFANPGVGVITGSSNNESKPKVPAANAIAYIGNSALLAGVNQLSETSKFLKNPSEHSSSQINKIKPGIVTIRSDSNVTRVGVEGNLLWLKVSRTGNSGGQFPIKVTLDEFPTRFSSTSNLNSYSLESRLTLQTSFLAIHRKSLLAMGGLTGSSTPMSATFDNIRQLPLAKDARLRFANDWSRVFTVKGKVPLEPGVNPHGRRGIIVDEGIIWFDDVEKPYFQEIEL